MHNYSGIICVMCIDSLVTALLAFGGIIFTPKSWKKIAKYIWRIFFIVWVLNTIVYYSIALISPDISVYTGELVEIRSTSNITMLFCKDNVFWNGEGRKPVLITDSFTDDDVIGKELEEGQIYTVYYESRTKIIVKVE